MHSKDFKNKISILGKLSPSIDEMKPKLDYSTSISIQFTFDHAELKYKYIYAHNT
jgi:hypothetical protein